MRVRARGTLGNVVLAGQRRVAESGRRTTTPDEHRAGGAGRWRRGSDERAWQAVRPRAYSSQRAPRRPRLHNRALTHFVPLSWALCVS